MVTSSIRSSGPFPFNASRDSITSRLLPTFRPITESIVLSTAPVRIPKPFPTLTWIFKKNQRSGRDVEFIYTRFLRVFNTRDCASFLALSRSLYRAAFPNFTSRIRADKDSAPFLEMIEPAKQTQGLSAKLRSNRFTTGVTTSTLKSLKTKFSFVFIYHRADEYIVTWCYTQKMALFTFAGRTPYTGSWYFCFLSFALHYATEHKFWCFMSVNILLLFTLIPVMSGRLSTVLVASLWA